MQLYLSLILRYIGVLSANSRIIIKLAIDKIQAANNILIQSSAHDCISEILDVIFASFTIDSFNSLPFSVYLVIISMHAQAYHSTWWTIAGHLLPSL